MRISHWNSDVCSSDLTAPFEVMDATAALQSCVPGNLCAFVVPRKLLDGKTTHQVGGRRAPCTSTLHTQQALCHQRQIALPVRLPGGNKYQFGKVGLAAAHQPPTEIGRAHV